MELIDLRSALRRNWGLALVGFLFWFLIGVLMAFGPTPTYTATAELAAEVSDDAAESAVETASFLLPVILAEVDTRDFRDAVEGLVDSRYADADIDLRAANEAGTPLVSVSASGPDAEATAAWATAAARHAVALRSGTRLELRLLDEASEPSTPTSPKPVPILFAATIAGSMTAMLASVIAYRLRRALDLAEDVERRLGLPVVGRIPIARSMRGARQDVADALTSDPQLGESFASVRTSLDLGMGDQRVLAVVSVGPGEGKSTVAAGIALMAAAAGQDVVAVDADLRKPELHNRLGERFGEGLAELGAENAELFTRQTRWQHLWLVPAGVPDRHPAEVLASRLHHVVTAAEARGRRVVIDCPPMEGLAETLIVVVGAGTAVVVVDGRRARLPELEAAVTQLRSAGVRIVGVVLNRVQRRRSRGGYAAYSGAVPPTVQPLQRANGARRRNAKKQKKRRSAVKR